MGARESSARGGEGSGGASAAAPDYYELLEVDENATPDEIKKSFRRLALIHHPDKNHDNIDEATQKFAALQQAYEVLSDDQERAWYDSHRASLVPEADAETVFEDIKRGAPPSRARDRGLTVGHLSRFFDPSVWEGFDDGEGSFFTIYRNLFARLKAEEDMIIGGTDYPSFGYSTWPWATSDRNELNQAKHFYNIWTGFATEKDFSWFDHYDITDAPDRRVRRLMEKENKKLRDDARRDYNDTIRQLAKFLRKRDPRYKAHLSEQSKATSGTATPKGSSATTNANNLQQKRTTQLAENYVEQEWQKVDSRHLHADLDWAAAEGNEDPEVWECVACRKTFRSEAAWDSHERSKKHLKEVERLMEEMRKEDEELGLAGDEDAEGDGDEDDDDHFEDAREEEEPVADDQAEAGEDAESPPRTPSPKADPPPVGEVKLATEDQEVESEGEEAMRKQKRKKKKTKAPVVVQLTKTERRAMKAAREESPEPRQEPGRSKKGKKNTTAAATAEPTVAEPTLMAEDKPEVEGEAEPLAEDDIPEMTKRDKRRARQAKKAEVEKTETAQQCNVCGEIFPSRTKLFAHISETGHALASGEDGGGKGKKGKKGKR